MRQFPPLIGAAGQPGYWVATVVRQDDLVRSFQALDPGQREALSRDWSAGRKLIAAHRDFLRQEVRTLRQCTWKQRLARAAYAAVTDQPATFFVILLVVVNLDGLVHLRPGDVPGPVIPSALYPSLLLPILPR